MLNLVSDVLPYKVLHESREGIIKGLSSNKNEEKFLDRALKSTIIDTTNISYKKTIELIFKIRDFKLEGKDINNLFTFNLKNESEQIILENQFQFDNNLKAAFISQMSREFERFTNIEIIIRTFDQIERFEVEKNKSIIDFTENDMLVIIDYYRKKYADYVTYRAYVRNIANFIAYVKKNFDNINREYEVKWEYKKIIKTIPDQEKPNQVMSNNEIMMIAKEEEIPQNAVILVLILNGLKLARNSEEDEIRNLREADVTGNTIKVHGSYEREISLNKISQSIIQESIKQEYFTSPKGSMIEMPRTGYLLRTFGLNKNMENIISEQSVQKRIRALRKEYENYISDRTFTYTTIRMAGRNNYIQHMIDDGYTLDEAVRLSMVKFGDVYSDNILKKELNSTEKNKAYKISINFKKQKSEK